MKKAPIPFTSVLIGVLIFFPGFSLWAATFNAGNPTEFQVALTTAAANGQNDVVNLAAGVYTVSGTLQYTSDENYSLTINGEGNTATILDGGGTVRILNIVTTRPNADVIIQNLRIQNGVTSENGGGLQVNTTSAAITFANSRVSDCGATGNSSVGGGTNLTTDSGRISVTASIFTNNTCSGNVGGLFVGVNTGSIHLTDSTFDQNTVVNAGGSSYFGDGGGAMLYSDGVSQIDVRGNTFSNNTASGGDNPDGGGMMIYPLGAGSTLTMEHNTFTDNHAGLGGGGCDVRLNAGGIANLNHNTFTGNQTGIGSGAGAMLYLDNGALTFTNNIFTGNQSSENGGGIVIEVWNGTATFSGNTFTSNQAAQNGGGMAINSNTTAVTISGNIFDSNTASNVGAGVSYSTTEGSATILSNTLYGNTASADGGGIYLYMDQAAAQVTMDSNILWQNLPDALDYSFGAGSIPIVMTYSDAQNSSGESWFGTGCIAADPLFMNAPGGDFNLRWTHYPVNDGTKSPCIDTGDPAFPMDPDTTRADMGAIPYTRSSPPATPKSQPGVNLLLLLQ